MNTAAIAPVLGPDTGNDPINSPRRAANRTPSSSVNTPAAYAAAISPTLWPNTADGLTPTLPHNSHNPASSAYNPGCVHRVSSSNPSAPSSPNITSSSDSPRSSRTAASHRSRAPRNTGSRSYNPRPIPAHWLPWPVNRKPTFGASSLSRAALDPAATPSALLPPANSASFPRNSSTPANVNPARCPWWLRPTPAVHAMSANLSRPDESPSSTPSSVHGPCSSSHST